MGYYYSYFYYFVKCFKFKLLDLSLISQFEGRIRSNVLWIEKQLNDFFTTTVKFGYNLPAMKHNLASVIAFAEFIKVSYGSKLSF
jgi:hypothetical protein